MDLIDGYKKEDKQIEDKQWWQRILQRLNLLANKAHLQDLCRNMQIK